MFAPGAVSTSLFSAIKAGRWAIAVAIFSLVLAALGGALAENFALLSGGWAAAVLGGRVWSELANPVRWRPNLRCRGEHPGRCALTVEVQRGREKAALSIAALLRERGLAGTFFLGPTVAAGLSDKLTELGHEIGGLNYHSPPHRLSRVTSVWHNRWASLAATRVGWSLTLGRTSSHHRAQRVVATDIVRLDANTPLDRLEEWLSDWDRRAVHVSTVSACEATAASGASIQSRQ